MLGSSSSVVMSPGPISLMPSLARPRSPKPFIRAVADFPAGTKTNSASGLASLTRCRNGAKSEVGGGMRTVPIIFPPPSVKPLVKPSCASWPGPKSATATYAVLNFFDDQVPIGKLDCHSVNDVRAMYGDNVVSIAVPAFMMMNGTFASVASGAIAAAFGVQTTPVIRFTLSRTISSWARRLAVSGLMPVSSRLMISIFTPAGSFDSFCFMNRSTAFWIWSPFDAIGPE